MQERPPYNITPEQGWSEMKTILDKSMPVEHRSRRFIFFWWATAAVIAIASVSFFLLHEGNPPVHLQPVAAPATQMTSNDNPASKEDNRPATTPLLNKDESSSGDINDKISVNKNLAKQKHHNENQNTLSSTSKNEIASINSLKLNPDNQTVNKNYKTDSNNFSDAETRVDQISLEENKTEEFQKNIYPDLSRTRDLTNMDYTLNEINAGKRNNSITAFLPLVDAWAYEIDQENLGPITAGSISSLKKNKRSIFNPFISVAGIAGSQNGLGVTGEIGTDYVISSKFSLTGSFGYLTYHPNAFHLGKVENADAYGILKVDNIYEGINSYLDGQKVNTSADYRAINPYVRSISAWQFTAGMKYKISRRFYMEGGFALGFGASAKSEYPIIDTGIAATPTAIPSESFDSYHVIRSTLTSLYGGIGYRFNKHVSVYANWSHGFDHYLLNDQNIDPLTSPAATVKRTDYLRGIKAGVTYNL